MHSEEEHDEHEGEEEHDEHEGEEEHDEHEEEEHHDEELGYLENSDYERESHKFGFSVVEDWGYIGASANILETHYGIPYLSLIHISEPTRPY